MSVKFCICLVELYYSAPVMMYKINLIVSVFMFDYVSTVISYSLIGVAVFLGKYDSLTPADIASVISQVSDPLKFPISLQKFHHQSLSVHKILVKSA